MHRYWPVLESVMPELSVVVPDLPIWNMAFAVRLVEEAILNVLSVEKYPADHALSSAANWKTASPVPALSPMVVRPALSMLNNVLVDEPMTKEGPVMPFGLTERSPHGEVVPMPTLPPLVAKYAELVELICVVEALPNVCNAVHVFAFPRLSPQSLIAPLPSYEEPFSAASLVRAARVEPSAIPEIVEFASIVFVTVPVSVV